MVPADLERVTVIMIWLCCVKRVMAEVPLFLNGLILRPLSQVYRARLCGSGARRPDDRSPGPEGFGQKLNTALLRLDASSAVIPASMAPEGSARILLRFEGFVAGDRRSGTGAFKASCF